MCLTRVTRENFTGFPREIHMLLLVGMLVAQNRQRFCQRIALCAKLIEYCIDPVHRIKIKRLFSL